MKKLIFIIATASSFANSGVIHAALVKHSDTPTYICRQENRYRSEQINGATYLSKNIFEVKCDAKKVEIKNTCGEKWQLWLTQIESSEEKTHVLSLRSLSHGKDSYYQVFSKPESRYLGLTLKKKISIDCELKL